MLKPIRSHESETSTIINVDENRIRVVGRDKDQHKCT